MITCFRGPVSALALPLLAIVAACGDGASTDDRATTTNIQAPIDNRSTLQGGPVSETVTDMPAAPDPAASAGQSKSEAAAPTARPPVAAPKPAPPPRSAQRDQGPPPPVVMPEPTPPPVKSGACTPEHAAMGHCNL